MDIWLYNTHLPIQRKAFMTKNAVIFMFKKLPLDSKISMSNLEEKYIFTKKQI